MSKHGFAAWFFVTAFAIFAQLSALVGPGCNLLRTWRGRRKWIFA
jgi:hypothetical protein